VNFKKGVFIVQEKGSRGEKKERIVPLTKYTYRLLRFRQEQNRPKKTQWVFPSTRLLRKDGRKHGRDLKGTQHIDNPKHIFKKMKRRAKYWSQGYESAVMDKINRHGLRRTLAKIAEHLGYDMQTLSGVLDHSNSGVTAKNYQGGTISEKRLKECYETCHNFIDNRLRAVVSFQHDDEKKDKKSYSPLLYLWGKPSVGLELDEYASSKYQHSPFDEETTAFPDMD
jgi:integrase